MLMSDARTEGWTDRETTSFHKLELLCNLADKNHHSMIGTVYVVVTDFQRSLPIYGLGAWQQIKSVFKGLHMYVTYDWNTVNCDVKYQWNKLNFVQNSVCKCGFKRINHSGDKVGRSHIWLVTYWPKFYNQNSKSCCLLHMQQICPKVVEKSR